MESVGCPLCSLSVTAAGLESHLRLEMDFLPFLCRLCPAAFANINDALHHFQGPFSSHLGQAPAIAEFPHLQKEVRLMELLSSTGERNVSQRIEERKTLSRTTPPMPSQNIESSRRSPNPYDASNTSSEAENPVPMRVKDEIVEMKPELSLDGKVACMLCGVRSAKRHFVQHVSDHHLSSCRFHCNHCTYTAKQKIHIRLHAKKQHGVETADAYTEMNLSGEIQTTMEQCFGSLQEVSEAKKTCASCKTEIAATSTRHHIITKHLQKHIHSCRLCDFKSQQLSSNEMGKHMRKSHGVDLGADNSVSDAEKYAPMIKKMTAQLFS